MMRGYWVFPGQGAFGHVEHHLTGAGIAGMVLMIILWVAIITAIVLAIRALILHSRRHRLAAPDGTYPPAATFGPAAPPTALLAILEERYAKGEIGREEFFQRKHDLGLGGQTLTPPSETPAPAAS